MKRLNFKPEIASAPFNTCNAWGFGGGIGTEWTFPNGLRYRQGTAYFRHRATMQFGRFLTNSNRDVSFAEGLKAVTEYLA